MEREKGVVKASCYACGEDVETAKQLDGGCAAVECDCVGAPEAASIVSLGSPPPLPKREYGVTVEPLKVDETPDA